MRKGFIDLESFLTILLVIMFSITGYSAWRIWGNKPAAVDLPNQWLSVCQQAARQLGTDLKYSRLLTVASDTLECELPGGERMKLQIASDSLVRIDAKGASRTVFSGLQSAAFHGHASLPGFVSLMAISREPHALPFFTSFCLRGNTP